MQWCKARNLLVLFPDPSLKEGNDLVYIEQFLGLDDMAFLNSVTPIRFMPRGSYVIIMWHCAIACMHVRAVDMLLCQAIRCHANHMTHASCVPQKSLNVYHADLDPFPPWGRGLGTRPETYQYCFPHGWALHHNWTKLNLDHIAIIIIVIDYCHII